MAWADDETREFRSGKRVEFERGYPARIVSKDGSWHRDVLLEDVSAGGAKLAIFGSIEGIDLDEFLLVLSTRGRVLRHCKRVWLNGDEIGVKFLSLAERKQRAAQASAK
jgi:hypothetical protein